MLEASLQFDIGEEHLVAEIVDVEDSGDCSLNRFSYYINPTGHKLCRNPILFVHVDEKATERKNLHSVYVCDHIWLQVVNIDECCKVEVVQPCQQFDFLLDAILKVSS